MFEGKSLRTLTQLWGLKEIFTTISRVLSPPSLSKINIDPQSLSYKHSETWDILSLTSTNNNFFGGEVYLLWCSLLFCARLIIGSIRVVNFTTRINMVSISWTSPEIHNSEQRATTKEG